MDEAGLERAVIGGQSMGAAVALVLALVFPHRVEAIVLVGGGAKLRIHPALLEANESRRDDMQQLERPFTGPEMELRPGAPPDAVETYYRLVGEAHGQAVFADLQANNSFDVMAQVAGITAPTLVVVGSEDRMTPPKFAEYLAGNISGARLCVLPDCGHYPQIEQPARFHAELEGFLADLDNQRAVGHAGF